MAVANGAGAVPEGASPAAGIAAISLLAISGSPRPRGNSEILLEQAIGGALSAGDVHVERFYMSKRRISACIHCNRCKEIGSCIAKDATNDLVALWLRADAVIYSTPVYHMGISSHLKAAIDKLGHVAFAQYNRRTPRFLKVIGAIAQGNSGFGGQELALLNLLQHAVVMNSLLVTADKPDSYMGVAGRVPNKEKGGIVLDQEAMEIAFQLGRRVYETAAIIKAGLAGHGDSLPPEYRYRREMVTPDKGATPPS
jgi:multimeric flavodoxin WrbA